MIGLFSGDKLTVVKTFRITQQTLNLRYNDLPAELIDI